MGEGGFWVESGPHPGEQGLPVQGIPAPARGCSFIKSFTHSSDWIGNQEPEQKPSP